MRRPLGQNPAQGSEVIGQKGPAHGLKRGAREVGLGKDAVLLLEIQHRRTHGRIVSARVVLGLVHETLTRQAFLHLDKGGMLGLHPQVRLHVARVARIGGGQFIQGCDAGLGTRSLQPQSTQPVFGGFLLFRAVAKGLNAIHRKQTGAVHARLAGPGGISEKARPQHRE